MKKLMGISLIAVLAVSPMMAMADNDPGATVTSNVQMAESNPAYGLKPANSTTDSNMASAGYVKGAYNTAIKALNKEHARAVAKETEIDNTIGSVVATEGANKGKVQIRGAGTTENTADDEYVTVAGGLQQLATEIDSLESANNSAVEAINSTIGTLTDSGLVAIRTGSNVTVASGLQQLASEIDGIDSTIGTLTQSGLVEIRSGSEVTVASGLQQLASEIDGINSASMTLTNKSFNASDATNSLTNVTKSNFASSAIAESVATTGASSDKLVTEAAVRAAVDAVSSTMTNDFATQSGVENVLDAAVVNASTSITVMDNWDADTGSSRTISVTGTLNSGATSYADAQPQD